ncbi:hypothetical protein Hypma_007913 [Hypsizygus marmoreus]|uniref:Uncharacterized protein n=1 Tax=Hypsizygus marmoreus TaxID=39966 RepID=A0A369JZU7_HYPMA|nr:hypothetical protein Hypma_007913 [Hypsizygus marmoreus]
MASLALGQADKPTPTPIPPPPSFSEFKFTTIGQEPQLLKRISAPTPDFQYQDRSSPSPPLPTELRYPSNSITPRPRSRPSLLEALADPNDVATSDAADDMAVDETSIQRTPSVAPRNALPTTAPNPSRAPLGWSQSVANNARPSPQAQGSTSRLTALSQAPIPITAQRTEIGNSSTTNRAAGLFVPSGSTSAVSLNGMASSSSALPQDSPYTGLRALQARLLSSLSHLGPPNTEEALRLVQSANSHSDTALLTAHRSHTLAQQSLASAREAVTAAKECLTAAEQARTHANDAAAAVKRITADELGVGGHSEWKTIINGLQDDIRALGEWVGEREGEETGRIGKEKERRDLVQSAISIPEGSGLDQATLEAISVEVAKRAAAIQANLTHPVNRERQRSAELEADAARRAWSLEHSQPPRQQPSPPAGVEEQEALARAQEQRRTQEAEEKRLKEEAVKREEEARAQRERQQHEEEIKAQRLRELEQQKLEVAKFQISEREQKERREAEELSKRTVEASRLQTEVEDLRKRRAEGKSKVVAEAKRALEAHKAAEKEKAQEEQRRVEEAERRKAAALEEHKKAEAKRLVEQRKQRELEELKKKQEAEKAAEAEAREAELRAAQGRRRQEVMAQKQRASAETAARILAERAKEKKLSAASTSTSPAPTTPTTRTGPLPVQKSPQDHQYGNLVAKKTVTAQATSPMKPRSISGGVKLGTVTVELNEQQKPDTAPLSPTLFRSAALGLRAKAQPQAVTPSPLPKRSSRAPPSQDQSDSRNPSKGEGSGTLLTSNEEKPISSNKSQSLPPVSALTTSTSSDTESIKNPAEDLHVHRRSKDPGNMPVVPMSQVPPASPQAQAANLRYVRDVNGVLWDTYLKPDIDVDNVKLEPPTKDHDLAVLKDQVSPPKLPRKRLRRGKLEGEPTSPPLPPAPATAPPPPASQVVHTPIPLPPKPTLPARPETNVPSLQPPSGYKATVTPAPRPPVSSQPTTSSSTSITLPRKPPLKLPEPKKRAEPSTNKDQLSAAPSDSSRNATTFTAPTAVRSPLDPRPTASTRKQMPPTIDTSNSGPSASFRNAGASPYDDYSQIAPAIQGDGGWDAAPHPMDEDYYDNKGARGRQFAARGSSARRGDHYSPARQPSILDRPISRPFASQDTRASSTARQQRNITPPEGSTLSPLGHSPVLGKRRYRDEPPLIDQPPAHRYRQTDNRDQGGYYPRSARTPPPVAYQWRTPSPDRPTALQSRIGVRDPAVYNVGAGQSYRPSYENDPYSPVHSRRTSDGYQPAGYTEYSSYGQSSASYQQFGRHQLTDHVDRTAAAALVGRGRGSATRGSARARGGATRGGTRPLNLEQRISSHKPLTLMHRLESPPRKY